MSVRILIVDDSQVMRAGLRAALGKRDDLVVVGEAADGDEVLAQVEALCPDLVIMDVEMRRVGGIDAARTLSSARPDGPKILMTSLYADDHLIAETLRAGAMGYVLKACMNQELAAAVDRVMGGGQFISRRVAVLQDSGGQEPLPRIAAELRRRLSPTERRLVDLLGEGRSDREAAVALGLSDEAYGSLSDWIAFRLSLDARGELAGFAKRGAGVENAAGFVPVPEAAVEA
jgi:DNA-binding NarL/FixJ family response regulator